MVKSVKSIFVFCIFITCGFTIASSAAASTSQQVRIYLNFFATTFILHSRLKTHPMMITMKWSKAKCLPTGDFLFTFPLALHFILYYTINALR